MVDVAQLAESGIVIPVVVGSTPIIHPKNNMPVVKLDIIRPCEGLVVGSSPARHAQMYPVKQCPVGEMEIIGRFERSVPGSIPGWGANN